MTCVLVALLFAATLTRTHYGTAIALLFIASMLAIGAGFTVFLMETWVGSRAVRIRSDLLQPSGGRSRLGLLSAADETGSFSIL